ncbi:MAG: beta-lactamase family protein [Holophagaceae bacterium]|nr:beta-lactamase family protein [Holophagaceae bacterium]
MTFHDLASLAKPLATATLAHAYLDLDVDRRWELGFHDREHPLTVRQLLSHSAGLPPWLPYTGEPLAAQLRRTPLPGNHPLLKTSEMGVSTYSDLGYRLIAELLELELRLPWKQLGAAASGLSPAPWTGTPMPIPAGQDSTAWAIAAPELDYPGPDPHLPHDANARAGMIGHAGFGASGKQLESALEKWMAARWPDRMAIETARSEDGEIWGLGLQRATAPYADLLARIPPGAGGVKVLESASTDWPAMDPAAAQMSEPSAFWQHLGYTGAAIFVRIEDRCCVALLCNRAGPGGELLSLAQLRGRRRRMLQDFLS